MTGGWGVYAGAVSIEAITVPALHPSFVLRIFFTYAYDAGLCTCICVLCKIIIIIIIIITSKQSIIHSFIHTVREILS